MNHDQKAFVETTTSHRLPDTDIDSALADVSAIRSVYQPVVEIDSGTVIGYEALARWPDLPGLDLESVFDTAAERGSLADLDWACRVAALNGASDAGMRQALCLFVNVEPHTALRAPEYARRVLRETEGRFTVVLELTERSLLADPAVLLSVVGTGRRSGCLIALDDVGVHPDTVTMLEFVAPDIIKLDRTLVQQDPDPLQARVIAAVRAHAEATGATILAEGIETREHLTRARSLGATLGQGFLFGGPAGLPNSVRQGLTPTEERPPLKNEPSAHAYLVPELPSDLLELTTPLIGTKAFLRSVAMQIEKDAESSNDSLAFMATFQHAQWFGPHVAERYARLAAKHAFVAAVGVGLGGEPAPGVRGAALEPGEEFVKEWSVIAVGQQYFSAMIARDLGDVDCEDDDRRFEFVHTHDRQLVVAAARSLMRRVIPT